MIISPGRRYIFVHVPKTGGTSLALALESRAMRDDILIGDTPKAKQRQGRLRGVKTAGRLWKHSTLADIDGLVGADALDDFLIFTLVRNPWDRLVSYYHWLREQTFEHPAIGLARRLDFAAFVAHPTTVAAFRAAPTSFYLRDGTGTERNALFLRLEHLAEDTAPLEAHLGFRLDGIDHVNRSNRAADYRPYYNDCTAQAVADCCAEDIARFGYRF